MPKRTLVSEQLPPAADVDSLSGVHSAVVELYKHVLPGVAAHHTRKLLTRAATLLLLLPAACGSA